MEEEDEQRFLKWVERFRRSTQTLENAEKSNFELFADSILAAVKLEENDYPDWIKAGSKLKKMASNSDDIKFILRHFNMPHAIKAYLDSSSDFGSEFSPLSERDSTLHPLTSSGGNDFNTFFESMKSWSEDSIVKVCKVADIQHRIVEASVHDANHVSRRLDKEIKRQENTRKELDFREKRLSFLTGKEAGSVVDKCMNVLKEEASSRSVELRQAVEDEEVAKKAYEAAVERRKRAQAFVQDIEVVADKADRQLKLLVSLNNKRLDIDKYNEKSSSSRIDMLQKINNFLAGTRAHVISGKLGQEMPQFLQNFIDEFRRQVTIDITESTADSSSSTYALCRIGLEVVRLWRQLCDITEFPFVGESMNQFEKLLYETSAHWKCPPADSPLTEQYYHQYDNSTLVLYYDHLLHNNPNDHFESQARVMTSLKALASQPPYSGLTSNQKSSRELKILQCNDLVAPPVWCLPLVHAPQYLQHLQALAQEAKDQDLLVPLEFDTEWESSSMSSDELDVEKEKSKDSNSTANDNNDNDAKQRSYLSGDGPFCRRFPFPSSVQDRLTKEDESRFEEMLAPEDDDIRFERMISREEDVQLDGIRVKRGRGRPRVIETSGKNVENSGRNDRGDEFQVNERVHTDYGPGIVVNESSKRDKIIKVKMEWGAVAFLNRKSIRKTKHLDVSGLSREYFVNLLLKKRVVPSVIERQDDRFRSTHPLVHSIVMSLVNHVGKQKVLTDALGFYNATLSLYIHGRTSPGLNATIESKMIKWIYRIIKLDVDARLMKGEKSNILNIFQPYSNQVKYGEDSSGEEREPGASYHRRGRYPGHSHHQNHNNNNNNNSDNDSAGEGNNSDSDREMEDKSGSMGLTTPRKRGRKRKSPEDDIIFHSSPEEEELRDILLRFMRTQGVSQTVLAAQYMKFGVESSQGVISGWFRYRLKGPLMVRLSNVAVIWLQGHRDKLSPEDWEKLERISSLRSAAGNVMATPSTPMPVVSHTSYSQPETTMDSIKEESDTESFCEDNNASSSSTVITTSDMQVDENETEMNPLISTPMHSVSSASFALTPSASGRPKLDSIVDIVRQLFPSDDMTFHPLTVIDLHRRVLQEIQRRHLSQAGTAAEACRLYASTAPAYVAKFIASGILPDNSKARECVRALLLWLLESSKMNVSNYNAMASPYAGASTPLHGNSTESFLEATCVCGRPRDSFPSNRSFQIHMNWCKKRMAKSGMASYTDSIDATSWSSIKKEADSTGNNHDGTGFKQENDMGEEGEMDASETPLSKKFKTEDGNNNEFDTSRLDEHRDFGLVVADSFGDGYHYSTCEVCKHAGNFMNCDTCPCAYHLDCINGDLPSIPWFCRRCHESGAVDSRFVTPEEKSGDFLLNKWVLVYSHVLRRWKQGCVMSLGPSAGIFLIKSVRSDGKGGRSQMVDTRNAKIRLLFNPPSITFAPSTFKPKPRGVVGRPRVNPIANVDGINLAECGTNEGISTTPVNPDGNVTSMSDTYVSSESLQAAMCAAATACRAVDIVMCNDRTNVFICARPPGHHAGRYGCTYGCLSTGFCLLNNAALALVYSRVRWGLERVAVVDIDVHFGNGTAEILRNDPRAFFASVHMVYGHDNKGETKSTQQKEGEGFYPSQLGALCLKDNYLSIGIAPSTTKEKSSTSTVSNVTKHTSSHSLESLPKRRGRPPRTVPGYLDSTLIRTMEESSDSDSGVVSMDEDDVASVGSIDQEEEVNDRNVKRSEGPLKKEKLSDDSDDSSDVMSLDEEEAEGETESQERSDSAEVQANVSADTSSSSSTPAPSITEDDLRNMNLRGSHGYRMAIRDIIIPHLIKFRPQLLIISAGFDGYQSDPLGGELQLSLSDYVWSTNQLGKAMEEVAYATGDQPRVISLLEGGYDTSPNTLGLARCVDAHVKALREI